MRNNKSSLPGLNDHNTCTHRQVIFDIKHGPGLLTNLLTTLFPDVFKAKTSRAALTSLFSYDSNDKVVIVPFSSPILHKYNNYM